MMKNKLLRLLKYIHQFGYFKGTLLFINLRLRRKLLFTIPGGFTIKIRGGNSDLDIFEQIFLNNDYYIKNLTDVNFIIDGGSNIGITTIYFKKQFPLAKIISIEPEPENFKLLGFNTSNLSSIQALQSAIWHTNKTLYLEKCASFDSHKITESDDQSFDQIETVSIDYIIEKNNRQIVDILKMDVEGAEKEIFENNYHSWLPNVRFLLIEMHDRMKKGCSKAVFKALGDYDFSIEFRGEIMICKNENIILQKLI